MYKSGNVRRVDFNIEMQLQIMYDLGKKASLLTRQPKINVRKNVQILSDLVLLNRKLSRHYTELDLALPC